MSKALLALIPIFIFASSALADPNNCPRYIMAKSQFILKYDPQNQSVDYVLRPIASQIIFRVGNPNGADGKQYVFYSYDTKTGKTTELKSTIGNAEANKGKADFKQTYLNQVNSDSLYEEYLVYKGTLYDDNGNSLKENVFYFLNTAEDKILTLQMKNYDLFGVSSKNGSDDRFAFFRSNAEKDFFSYNLKTGKKKKLSAEASMDILKFVPGSDLMIGRQNDGSLVVLDLRKGKIEELINISNIPGRIENFEPLSDDKLVVLMNANKADGSGTEKMLKVFSIDSGKFSDVEMLKGLKIEDSYYGNGSIKDYRAFNPETGEYFYVLGDLSKMIPIGKTPNQVEIQSPNERHVVFTMRPDENSTFYSYKVYDRKSGTLFDLPNLFLNRYYPKLDNGSNDVYFELSEAETKTRTFYRYNLDKQALSMSSSGATTLNNSITVGNGALFTNTNTYRYVALKNWKPIEVVADANKYFDLATYKAMKIETELPSIELYFSKKLYNRNPYWALPYLMLLLKKSEILFETFIETHGLANDPKLLKIISKKSYDESLVASWKKDVKKYIEYTLEKNPERSGTTIDRWKNLTLFKPIVSKLPKDYLKEVSMHIARCLANGAYHAGFNNILHAKLLKFAHQTVRKWFGMDSRILTDLELIRESGYYGNPNEITPALLGSEPLEGVEKMNDYGFYYKALPKLMLPTTIKPGEVVLDRKFEWAHGGYKYTGKLTAKALDIATEVFSPKITAPDYASMWKDGEFNGMLMIGDGFGDEADLIDSYMDYYQEQGFKFKREDKVIEDVGEYLAENVKNGKLDYFIKEAHSDGDGRNLFRYVTQGKLHIGTKKHADGKIEKIIFVENIAGKTIGKLLSNAEFGTWMRDRATAGHGNFVYFNTSCSSTVKVANEVESAHTPTLIVLGGNSTMETFGNDEISGMRAVLDGFRKGLSFEEIRKLLEATANYKNGYDRFVFPDEADFETAVRSRIKTPLEINVVIKDQNKKNYEIDDAPTQQND